jgi:transposase
MVLWIDESGFMLQPVVRRTWAPKGQTPIHYSWGRHDRLSVLSGLAVNLPEQLWQLFFEMKIHNLCAEDIVEFLKPIALLFPGKIIVVLDRWSAHRKAMRLLAEQLPNKFEPEWLPAYAPDLNPVELVWSQAKYAEMANYIPENIEALQSVVSNNLSSYATRHQLLEAFFNHTALEPFFSTRKDQ